MRKLPARPYSTPTLAENLAVWARQWDELRVKNPDAEFPWYTKDKKSARQWILDELLAWSYHHCAFCDGMGGTTNWPVEHFKPKAKSKFPELAYAWSNLYPCCEKCQGKGDWWEDEPALLRPDEIDYDFTAFFIHDYTAPDGVALLANPLAGPEREKRAQLLIRIY